MPSRVRCFALDSTDQVAVSLRRFSSKTRCGRSHARYPGHYAQVYDYHDAEVEIARETGTLDAGLDGRHESADPADGRAWPTSCSCGYVFAPGDLAQEGRERLYRRRDTGELYTIPLAPAGALYDRGDLYSDSRYQRNGAGSSLVCKTPAGEWLIDGPANNGPGWTRTGAVPDISVTPSIAINRSTPEHYMHGWLRAGWLEIDAP